ncbi:MAG: hypothetical protein KatS3mg087_1350 [Patescibacteria group bacterium]|nr:MAG: hypothetical protein KatS3mg087_1350 [Patescibacteria group bacterium]
MLRRVTLVEIKARACFRWNKIVGSRVWEILFALRGLDVTIFHEIKYVFSKKKCQTPNVTQTARNSLRRNALRFTESRIYRGFY